MAKLKVFLLGSTGRLGKEILKRLISEGIETSILVREAKNVDYESKLLSVFEGDPSNVENLQKLLFGCNVIITALNISRKNDFPWSKLRTPKTFLSETMKNLIELSDKNNIRKIITISAWGANESKSQLPIWFKWVIDNSNVKYGYQDHERQEKLLVESGKIWTIIRPVGLSNSQKDGSANVSVTSETSSLMVSRKAVANFIVDNLNSSEYENQVVTLS